MGSIHVATTVICITDFHAYTVMATEKKLIWENEHSVLPKPCRSISTQKLPDRHYVEVIIIQMVNIICGFQTEVCYYFL